MKILDQKVHFEDNYKKCTLVTKYDDGSIKSEPITPSEAAEWVSQLKF